MIIKLMRKWIKETTKQVIFGGSVWESNPPTTLHMPHNGFEVREAHRDLNAPPDSGYYVTVSASALF